MNTGNNVPGDDVIVVVDDMKDNVHFLMDILKAEGYRVRPALSGTAALTIIENETPDMILLDIMMPVMDGYEVCRKIRERPEYRHIPIIFLSALDDVTDKVKGFSAGGVDYITKPFMAEEVLARIGAHLAIKRLRTDLLAQNTRLKNLNDELQQALGEIKILKRILTMCSNCRRIKDENGMWVSLEGYIRSHTDTNFSHGVCQECARELYPDWVLKK
jgi:DNA-binding response OmpR family regulator